MGFGPKLFQVTMNSTGSLPHVAMVKEVGKAWTDQSSKSERSG